MKSQIIQYLEEIINKHEDYILCGKHTAHILVVSMDYLSLQNCLSSSLLNTIWFCFHSDQSEHSEQVNIELKSTSLQSH